MSKHCSICSTSAPEGAISNPSVRLKYLNEEVTFHYHCVDKALKEIWDAKYNPCESEFRNSHELILERINKTKRSGILLCENDFKLLRLALSNNGYENFDAMPVIANIIFRQIVCETSRELSSKAFKVLNTLIGLHGDNCFDAQPLVFEALNHPSKLRNINKIDFERIDLAVEENGKRGLFAAEMIKEIIFVKPKPKPGNGRSAENSETAVSPEALRTEEVKASPAQA